MDVNRIQANLLRLDSHREKETLVGRRKQSCGCDLPPTVTLLQSWCLGHWRTLLSNPAVLAAKQNLQGAPSPALLCLLTKPLPSERPWGCGTGWDPQGIAQREGLGGVRNADEDESDPEFISTPTLKCFFPETLPCQAGNTCGAKGCIPTVIISGTSPLPSEYSEDKRSVVFLETGGAPE